MSDPINSNDPDVSQVAAALADAVHAGGLSEGYYRTANDALARLRTRHAEAIKLLRDAEPRLSSAASLLRGLEGMPRSGMAEGQHCQDVTERVAAFLGDEPKDTDR